MKPIKKKILVRKCTTGERKDGAFFLGNIAIPDSSAEACGWAEILEISEDCKLFSKSDIGAFVNLPAWKPGLIHSVDGIDFIVREKLFELPPNQGGAHPYIYRE